MVIGGTNKLVSAAATRFSEKELNQYESALLLSAGFFCVALLRSDDRTLSYLAYSGSTDFAQAEANWADLPDFFNQIPFPLHQTRMVRAAVCGGKSMLVPEFLCDTQKRTALFDGNFGPQTLAPESIAVNAEMQLLYLLPAHALEAVRQAAPSAETLPLEYFFLTKSSKSPNGSWLQCHLSSGQLLLVARKADQIVLVNKQSVRTEHDALYHTCNTALRLGFSLHDTEVRLSGTFNLAGDYFKHLSRYFGKVVADNGHPGTPVDAAFADIKMHYFSALTYL